jgi:hypothetical protein
MGEVRQWWLGFLLIVFAVMFPVFAFLPFASIPDVYRQLTGMSWLLAQLPFCLILFPFATIFFRLGIKIMQEPLPIYPSEEPSQRRPYIPADWGDKTTSWRFWVAWPLAIVLLVWIEHAWIASGRPKDLALRVIVLETIETWGMVIGMLCLIPLGIGLLILRDSLRGKTIPVQKQADGPAPIIVPGPTRILLSDDAGQRREFERLLANIAGFRQYPSTMKRWLAWLLLLVLGVGSFWGFFLILVSDTGTITLAWGALAIFIAFPTAIFAFTLYWFMGALASYRIDLSGFHRRGFLGIGSWSAWASELDSVTIVRKWYVGSDGAERTFLLKLKTAREKTHVFPVFPAFEAELKRLQPDLRPFFETPPIPNF